MTRKKQKKRNVYEQVDVIPPACRKCGSTDRTGYVNVRTIEISGETATGQPYTQMTLKRTMCKGCGQHRIDRVFENPKTMYESRTSA